MEPRCTSEIARFFGAKRFLRALIVSDHTPEIGAINRRRGRSFENNTMVSNLLKHFPQSRFKALHLPGAIMPADPISRGKPLAADSLELQVLEKLIQTIKTGRTAYSEAEARPIAGDDSLTVLDNSNSYAKHYQIDLALKFIGQKGIH